MKISTRITIIVIVAAAVASVIVLKERDRAQHSDAPGDPAAVIAATKPLPRLLDLGADKCVPCKLMAPILEELANDYTNQMEIEFIDVWKNGDAAEQYGVESIPTQIFYAADGTELYRHTGFFGREDILNQWKELGVVLEQMSPE